MHLAAWSLAGLVGLVVLSHITTFVFHILNDQFYSYFHLTAGILATFLFFSFTSNFLLSIIFTQLLGVAWEMYEWYSWKFIIKRKKYQPQPDDTRNDLLVDFVGSLIGVITLALWLRT